MAGLWPARAALGVAAGEADLGAGAEADAGGAAAGCAGGWVAGAGAGWAAGREAWLAAIGRYSPRKALLWFWPSILVELLLLRTTVSHPSSVQPLDIGVFEVRPTPGSR